MGGTSFPLSVMLYIKHDFCGGTRNNGRGGGGGGGGGGLCLQAGTHTYLFRRSTMDFNRGRGISGILHATVDIHFRVFTDDHGLFFCVCVCLCVSINYLTMNYPLPLRKSIMGLFFTCMPMRFATKWRVSDNRGCPWLVCVHGYTVIFLMRVHG